eukprot:Skav236413  [mRNA]  locus=scaffold4178:75544:94472:+ [translate_table: standard]
MKKQGLPSVFAADSEILAVSDLYFDEDATTTVDISRRAIDSPEEDRKIHGDCVRGIAILLQRVKGTTVMRRAPETHEAIFDFGESRVSVPRELQDVAGQLQRIEVDMKLGWRRLDVQLGNDDGTGNIVITTQTPRRFCNAALPKSLEGVVDVGQLQKNVKQQLEHETHSVPRHITRPPPSVKEWEAWREIQRQKRLEMEDAMRKMQKTNEDATEVPWERHGTARAFGKAVRTAERKDKDSIPVAEKMQAPWDAAPPPKLEEIHRALEDLGVHPELKRLGLPRKGQGEGPPSLQVLDGSRFYRADANVKQFDEWMRNHLKTERKLAKKRELPRLPPHTLDMRLLGLA